MPKLGTKKWKQRVAEVLRSELQQPEVWQYVSFADEVFRGVVIIKAHGITDAVTKIHALNINPGGQVICLPMPNEMLAQVHESDRERLLTKEDVLRIWPDAKSIKEHESETAGEAMRQAKGGSSEKPVA